MILCLNRYLKLSCVADRLGSKAFSHGSMVLRRNIYLGS